MYGIAVVINECMILDFDVGMISAKFSTNKIQVLGAMKHAKQIIGIDKENGTLNCYKF